MIDYRDMALKALVPGCQYASQNNEIFWDEEENNGVVCPSQEQIQAKIEKFKQGRKSSAKGRIKKLSKVEIEKFEESLRRQASGKGLSAIPFLDF